MIAKEGVGQSSRSKGECVSCSLIASQICGTGLIGVTSRWRQLHFKTHEKDMTFMRLGFCANRFALTRTRR